MQTFYTHTHTQCKPSNAFETCSGPGEQLGGCFTGALLVLYWCFTGALLQMETFKCFWKRCLGLVSGVTGGGGNGHILYLAIWGRSCVFLTAVCGLVRGVLVLGPALVQRLYGIVI
jgi:hypothetical protein